MADVTRILNSIERGDAEAINALLPAVYEELRQMAGRKLANEGPGHTLQATALVHEAYLRLVGSDDNAWSSRTYFFGAAAEAMRRILVEHARKKRSKKRGGDRKRVDFMSADVMAEESPDDLIALDEALTKFSQTDPLKAELVKLRFFAGLSFEQAAGLLDISPATARRHWNYARAWLYGRICSTD
ncbi:MAG: sigma-70 family RNA polymerase sigma factor [Planctomycetes bacterium]|nr:sigma-70 family RNA polymerase sigma factor [Planctomycetota bacterium]